MIKTKRTIELEEENIRLQNEIKSLNNDIKRLKQRYNELDEIRQKASSRAKYCEYELEESKKEIEDLKNVINEKDEELSDYKRCNQNILRINKERENAKRGLYPKKEHVGYCLRETGPKDYKCYIRGSHKTVKLFFSTFQTPYNMEFDYYDVEKMVDSDLWNEEECRILDDLECETYLPNKRYEDIAEHEIKDKRREIFNELIDEYKEKHNNYSPSWEEECRYREISNEEEIYFVFNRFVRLNGERGYWEVVLTSTYPLPVIPKEMRFRKGNKDVTKSKDV